MSAIRNSSSRGEARKKNSSPYAIGSIFKKIGNLFGLALEESSQVNQSNSSASTSSSLNGPGPSNSLSRHERYAQLALNHERPPLSPVNNINNPAFSSSGQNLASSSNNSRYQTAASVVSETYGRPVSTAALQNFVSSLGSTSPPPDTNPHHQTFRFSFTPPQQTATNPFSPSDATQKLAPGTRRTLAKNPNGSIRWEGGGSAKKNARTRNRFASPAFGASPLKQSSNEATTDKKRRVGESSTSDAPRNVTPLPFPITASPSAPPSPNKAPQRPSLVTTTALLRTPVKATTPVVPSPLRQAWSEVSPSSSFTEEPKPTTQPSKPTQTATFMAELIKESAPPKKPDLSNPYQTASPVGKVGPPRRSARRPRATNRASLPQKNSKKDEETPDENKDNEKEQATAQAIIEATLPKGSKRSRPPANLEKAETYKQPYVVEEVEEDQDRSTKRSKPSLEGRGVPPVARAPSQDSVVVQDLDDDVAMSGPSQKAQHKSEPPKLTVPTNVPASRSFKSAAPKEPSKLRFSIQADAPSSPAPPISAPVAPVPEPLAPPKPFAVPTSGFTFTVNTPQEKKVEKPAAPIKEQDVTMGNMSDDAAKNKAKEVASLSLPVFVLTATGVSVLPSTAEHVRARDAALAASASSLPRSDLVGPAKLPSAFTFAAPSSSPPAAPVAQGFNWAAIGKAPPSSKATQKCTLCGLDSPASAEKCTVCENPMPGATPAAPATSSPAAAAPIAPPTTNESKPAIVGFNWAAIGKAPPAASQGNKSCGVCGLSTSAALPDCTICGSPL